MWFWAEKAACSLAIEYGILHFIFICLLLRAPAFFTAACKVIEPLFSFHKIQISAQCKLLWFTALLYGILLKERVTHYKELPACFCSLHNFQYVKLSSKMPRGNVLCHYRLKLYLLPAVEDNLVLLSGLQLTLPVILHLSTPWRWPF